MATEDLYKPLDDQAIKEALKNAEKTHVHLPEGDYKIAIDYWQGRMFSDTHSLLRRRYPQTQSGGSGQWIEPVPIPLIEKYVGEAANAYNKPVKRELEYLDGRKDDETAKQTDKLHGWLSDSGYQETMHQNEQLGSIIRCTAIDYGAKRGLVKAPVISPHLLTPIPPVDDSHFCPTDSEDYLAHVVSLSGNQSIASADQQVYKLITRAYAQTYMGKDPFSIAAPLDKWDNPYTWEQTIDSEDMRGKTGTFPLFTITYWHWRPAYGELLIRTDPDIVQINRELNVLWSVLMDTIRIQGFGQMVAQLVNKNEAPAMKAIGSRFCFVVGNTESISFASAPANYTQWVEVLKAVPQVMAIAKRHSPNDYAEGASPQSGFAKLVDSLPKIEAREEKIPRLQLQEENVAWPRLASIGMWVGRLDESVKKMRMKAQFADVEFPQNAQEETAREQHDIDNNLTSAVEILMKRHGITEEQAIERLEKNREHNKAKVQAQVPGELGQNGQAAVPQEQQDDDKRKGLLGALIAAPEPLKPADNQNGEAEKKPDEKEGATLP